MLTREADLILFVGAADDNPQSTLDEQRLVNDGKGAHKKLVLLHFDKREVQPGSTSKWMKVNQSDLSLALDLLLTVNSRVVLG
jgi:hypothetical protein